MEKLLFVIAVLTLFSVFSASAAPTRQVAATTDTLMQKMNVPPEKEEQSISGENEPMRGFKNAPWNKRRSSEAEEWHHWRNEPMSAGMLWPSLRHPVFFRAAFLLICLSIVLLINILLTILVALDMAQRQQFNGLWIPILILAGIPGTALYALFRIGDMIRAASGKTA